MTRVAITQSNYIPWKGYFDLINRVDELVLFDSVQYTRRDWRNRNKIKTPDGSKWLTIPVLTKGKFEQRICDAVIKHDHWRDEHWKSLQFNYARARHFETYADRFETLYQGSSERNLSQVNYAFITAVCDILGIETRITWSMDYDMPDDQTGRLIYLCQQLGGTGYISGPSARDYLDEDQFRAAGIKVTYMDYSDYPVYEQLFPPFDHHVSILDLIFNAGPDAPQYMKSFS